MHFEMDWIELCRQSMILSQPSPVQFKTGATRYSVGTPHPTNTNSPKLKIKRFRVDQKTNVIISLYDGTPILFSD